MTTIYPDRIKGRLFTYHGVLFTCTDVTRLGAATMVESTYHYERLINVDENGDPLDEGWIQRAEPTFAPGDDDEPDYDDEGNPIQGTGIEAALQEVREGKWTALVPAPTPEQVTRREIGPITISRTDHTPEPPRIYTFAEHRAEHYVLGPAPGCTYCRAGTVVTFNPSGVPSRR